MMTLQALKFGGRRRGTALRLALTCGLGVALVATSDAQIVTPAQESRAPTQPLQVLTSSPALQALPRAIVPRNMTRSGEQNEWNPRFAPDGQVLSFERRAGSAQALYFLDPAQGTGEATKVSSLAAQSVSVEDALLGGGQRDDSFNAQIAFYPDSKRFVFMGNAGTGVYRLYEGQLPGTTTQAITAASKEDGHPAVSPDGRFLAYVSARGGIGKLFLRDLASGVERQLTQGAQIDLFPAWSPDARALAYVSGDNDNHDIFLIRDVTLAEAAPLRLTSWSFDDLRPVFSPDGRSLAFYSNYSPTGEDKEWSIVVIAADGSGPSKGQALTKCVAATNVTKDIEVGPAWLPSGKVIVFARNLKAEWNPVYFVDVETREERRLETGTRMNHDLTCSSKGWLAFRAQVASWDDIFVAPLGTP
ncbi:MAG: hypothetical protein MUF51_09280 [Vicinamibacteria bacterium]|jgi:Tol biopolymer transport system component|nr:hypothetical protein [Vicinamibacteria bacterium]